MRRSLRELGNVAICFAIAVMLTWPLVRVFTTRVCGDTGDPFQTLWGMRWIRDALVSFRNPFFSDRVFHPTGSTLVFQTFDLPSAVAMVPLWGWISEVAIYNTAVLLALTVTVYGMFRLVREHTGDALVAFAAGTIFAAVPYQFAHLRGHLHLLAMGWLPLYLVHLHRIVAGRGNVRDGVSGGVFLALASLASWYHLLYALILTLALMVHGMWVDRRALGVRSTVRAGGALLGTWLVLVGPLVAAMLVARAREPITGAHDAVTFSADLYAFVFPNAAQLWRSTFGAHFEHWTGNPTENAAYVGYTVLALAAVGAWTTSAARPYVVAAGVGAVLALGPQLHLDGQIRDIALPYAFLERVFPLMSLAGVPVRFAYVMYLGLTVAAAVGLVRLRASVHRFGRAATVGVVVIPLALALTEYWPQPVLTSAYAIPAPMRSWASDPTPFAVLDIWDAYRPMWHATIHRKPMVGAYLTRVPVRLDEAYQRHPVMRAILYGGNESWVQRVDPTLDFDWRDAGPESAITPDQFRVTWGGTLLAPLTGTYEFWLAADDAGVVTVDGRVVLRREGPCPADGECAAHASVTLEARSHPIRVEYRERTGPAGIHFSWRPPGGVRVIVPSSALRTSTGQPGLDAEYNQPVSVQTGLGLEGGRAALRDLGIRYVITGEQGNACVERELRLPLSYAGEDVRIYEVPAPAE